MLTVWANCSSPASVWNMMCRRRLWKSVQLEALVTWVRGQYGLRGPAGLGRGALSSSFHPGAGAHLTKMASAWHPGLNVKLAVGREAQFLGGHVQDPAATVKDKVKVRGERGTGGNKNGGDKRDGGQKSGQWK